MNKLVLQAHQRLTKKRPKLMLVDDQPFNIELLQQLFAAEYDLCMATSGSQALEICAQHNPDLILLDIEMPGMDGFEVCERLKADPITQDIPIIFLSAHRDEASETRALDAGAQDFIYKPINLRIVRARIKTHILLKIQTDLLRNWVYIDGLTNVHNRRYFDERLSTEWSRAQRNGTELSLILIDVDFFKDFNDHYSHQAGDDCLRLVAASIQAHSKRPADLVARYGGEEFVCLLPETGLEGALHFAEQLRGQIMALNIAHAASSVAAMVTASFGLACKPVGYQGVFASLLQVADKQLYRAKDQGRNQTCGALL
jgi:diguanylate cyclase (GGDEF)-like protein